MTDPAYRLFFAIELPADVRHQIRKHIDRLRAAMPEVRASWTREENLHLTLKFLGDTPVEKVEALSQALKNATTGIAPFEMTIAECGAFPLRGKPNVLWIGVSVPPAVPGGLPAQLHASPIQTLFQSLEDECAGAGVARETRSFHPHLTIARLRHTRDARPLAQLHKEIGFVPLSVKVEDACLIRSELSSKGSRYTIIARHKIQ